MQKGLRDLPAIFHFPLILTAACTPALLSACACFLIVVQRGTVQAECDAHNSNMVTLAVWAKNAAFVPPIHLSCGQGVGELPLSAAGSRRTDLCLSELWVNNSAANCLSARSAIVLILTRTRLF